MNDRAMAHPDPVTLRRLLWAAGCCALAAFANLPSLPVWVLLVAFAAGGARVLLAMRGAGPPPPIVLVPVAAIAIVALLLRFHTLNGITAGTGLLCLMAGLKLLETRRLRDIHVIVLIIYFLGLAALLRSESFWLLTYVIGVCFLATATLVQLTVSLPGPGWRESLRHAGRMLAHALPLALFLWLLFPRLAEPLWKISDEGGSAVTGLSDTMDPGEISDLVLSDDIAFRAHFAGAVPSVRNRYWRGPVLEEFNGHLWRRNDRPVNAAASIGPLRADAPVYSYTIGLEPYPHNWIYSLDRPVRWNVEHARLSDSGVLERRDPISQPIDVVLTSIAGAAAPGTLEPYLRSRDLALPPQRNPRTAQLARQMRGAHPDERDYVRSVLAMLHDQAFFYTLTPPHLGENSVDDFLFDSRRGFCGHYASAFAVMMRAAGIPARVVTGYLGGMENPYGHYWIIRQSDAHAWVEVWIEGSGWLRIDPTAAIASTRVEQGGADDNVNALLGIDLHRQGSWLADLALRLDALRQFWIERILQFDQSAQQSLLQQLAIPVPDTGKFALLLALCVGCAFGWMSWQVRRDISAPASDRAARAFKRFCARLAKIGLPREAHEGAEAFAARIALARPDLGDAIRALMRQYSDVRYGADAADRAAVARLVRAMRGFALSRET
jgi:protein-glutamine gamma-glutamyltransferase